MTAEVISQPNGVVANGGNLDLNSNPKSGAAKKSRESERRRRRRKQKKNQKASKVKEAASGEDSDASGDNTKENDDLLQVFGFWFFIFYFFLRWGHVCRFVVLGIHFLNASVLLGNSSFSYEDWTR